MDQTRVKPLPLQPPARIGIIGGGQLGKMITAAAKRMGYCVTVLDPNPAAPAGQIADQQIVAGFADAAAIRSLAARSDVTTFEYEHIHADALINLELEGYSIYPSGSTLKLIQDKYVQKQLLRDVGVAVPEFMAISCAEDLNQCPDRLGYPFMLKHRRGGYDGKGNIVIRNRHDLARVSVTACRDMMAERFVDYERELSVMVARTHDGQTLAYPVAENHHEQSILRTTRVPADIRPDIQADVQHISSRVMQLLDDCGIFCLELFLTRSGQLLINEIAPRPHNTGHYSIEACVTSQFEQLVRIICHLPPGSCRLRSPSVMVNILGSQAVSGAYQVTGLEKALLEDDTHVHLYGKEQTAYLKKIGHITALDASLALAEAKCMRALQHLELQSLDIQVKEETA